MQTAGRQERQNDGNCDGIGMETTYTSSAATGGRPTVVRLATAPARRPSRGWTYVAGGTLGESCDLSQRGQEERTGDRWFGEKLCQEIGAWHKSLSRRSGPRLRH